MGLPFCSTVYARRVKAPLKETLKDQWWPTVICNTVPNYTIVPLVDKKTIRGNNPAFSATPSVSCAFLNHIMNILESIRSTFVSELKYMVRAIGSVRHDDFGERCFEGCWLGSCVTQQCQSAKTPAVHGITIAHREFVDLLCTVFVQSTGGGVRSGSSLSRTRNSAIQLTRLLPLRIEVPEIGALARDIHAREYDQKSEVDLHQDIARHFWDLWVQSQVALAIQQQNLELAAMDAELGYRVTSTLASGLTQNGISMAVVKVQFLVVRFEAASKMWMSVKPAAWRDSAVVRPPIPAPAMMILGCLSSRRGMIQKNVETYSDCACCVVCESFPRCDGREVTLLVVTSRSILTSISASDGDGDGKVNKAMAFEFVWQLLQMYKLKMPVARMVQRFLVITATQRKEW
ncbi:hypothetical protein KCU92_g107, partial [Aureobasidium melanogenum]